MTSSFEERRALARQVLETYLPLPSWVVDQLDAAAAEAWRRFMVPAGAVFAYGAERDGDEGRAAMELLIAATIDCEACCHIRRARGPVPMLVALPLHLALCERCSRTVRNPPPGEEDRCDLCGSRGNTSFTPFQASLGSAVVGGDAGPCCARRLGMVTS